MDLLFLFLGTSLVVGSLSVSAMRCEKKTGKKLGRGSAAAGLQVINELFQPSAANAALLIEEKKEARMVTPSPEDKDLDGLIADYLARQNKEKSI
jgi:hypothetical protein